MPVLKVKRGEKSAMGALASSVQARITPLLDIVSAKGADARSVNQVLDTSFKGLPEAVHAFPVIFLDAHEIAESGADAAERVFARAEGEGIRFTPVTGFSRSHDVAAALKRRENGVAIRVTRKEFGTGEVPVNLPGFLARHGLVPGEIDLIVDLGDVGQLIAEGVESLARAFLSVIPDHASWRTLTLSGCAFPLSMAVVPGQSSDVVERAEWLAWRALALDRASLTRLPTFGDCAIQHPRGVEGFDPLTMSVSAAIRYALPEAWLLIKGVSTKKEPAIVQFPKLAAELVNGRLSGHFAGSAH